MNTLLTVLPHSVGPMLAAARLTIGTLMTIGAFGGLMIMAWTYSNWRAGVKVALIIALFEGAIRKWGFPSGQELIYFLKDVFLAGAYLRFYFAPDDAVRSRRLAYGTGFIMLACLVVSFSALSPNLGSPLLALYGLKIYLYYLPLIFMIPYLYETEEDLKKGLLYFALFATPICLLGIAQWAAPGSSFLNIYAQSTDETIITEMAGSSRVRITGTFSYLTGHTTFLVVFFSLHVALLCTALPKWATFWLMANLPLLAANSIMSGSRGVVLYMVLFVAIFLVAATFIRISRGKSVVMVLAGVVALGGGLAVTVFREATANWYVRATESGDSVKSRTIDHPTESLKYAINEVGFIGYGIGLTHPAMDRIRKVLGVAPPRVKAPVYDLEISQVYVELGFFGFMFWYGLRFMLVKRAYTCFANTHSDFLRPLLFASWMVQLSHMILSFVLNHTAGILVCACAGLSFIPALMPTSGQHGLPQRSSRSNYLPSPVAPIQRRGSRLRY
jgi:hypothetical protein